jgi:PEP-CTERM motif
MLKRILLVAALACAIPCVLSAETVTMELTGPPPGPSLGGVYISPYTALIGPAGQTTAPITGVSTPIICDDFETDVSTSTPPWQAIVTNVASLAGESSPNTNLKFDTTNATKQQLDYTVAAYLATEIMQAQAAGNVTAEGDLSYALWGLFDSLSGGPLSGSWVTGTDLTNAISDLSAAINAVTTEGLTVADYSNVTIYTPTPQRASQEYIVVNTPEPSTLLMLALGIGGLLMLWRRRQRNAAAVAA